MGKSKSHGLTDAQLAEWADEHLVFEAKMLAFTAFELGKRAKEPRGPMSNALLESFAVHARNLHDFFYGVRKGYGSDAFAFDFYEPGEWEKIRDEEPAALVEIAKARRFGKEVVHLSYDRRDVEPEAKDWPISDVAAELIERLHDFVEGAKSERLLVKTREALGDLQAAPSPGSGPLSVATSIAMPYTGGTVEIADRIFYGS